MDDQITVKYSHLMGGEHPIDNSATEFYKTLPNVEQTFEEPETGMPDTPIPNIEQILRVSGITSLSSTELGERISEWLSRTSARITLSDPFGDPKLVFQGPDSKLTPASIKEKIEELVSKEGSEFLIRATPS